MSNPLDGFTVTAQDLWYVGEGLQRPECILAEPDGSLWSADARGGVVHIRPDGTRFNQRKTRCGGQGGPRQEGNRRAEG